MITAVSVYTSVPDFVVAIRNVVVPTTTCGVLDIMTTL